MYQHSLIVSYLSLQLAESAFPEQNSNEVSEEMLQLIVYWMRYEEQVMYVYISHTGEDSIRSWFLCNCIICAGLLLVFFFHSFF